MAAPYYNYTYPLSNNLPQTSLPQNSPTPILNGVLFGGIAFVIVVVCHLAWAMLVYRKDPDYIGQTAQVKYEQEYAIKNKGPPPVGTFIKYNNVRISPDKTYATIDMEIRNKITQEAQGKETIKYTIP